MATPYPVPREYSEGKLEFVKKSTGIYDGYFTPPVEALNYEGDNPGKYKLQFLKVDYTAKTLTFAPFHVGGTRTMMDRYQTLKTIRLDMPLFHDPGSTSKIDLGFMLSSILPDCFILNYNYGSGFLKKYRPVTSALDRFSIKKLQITKSSPTLIDQLNGVLTLQEEDLR